MKKYFLTSSAFILMHLFSFATNISGGNVSGTWALSGSPYNIQGSIIIPNNSTLTIEPGVTVNFLGTYKLLVLGRILAIGTVNDTINFTATNITNGWRGIRFDNTPTTNDSSKIIYCKLQYGKATGSWPDDNGGAFYFSNFSNTIISNCYISDCIANGSGGGIYCSGSNPIITNNIITNNLTTSFNSGSGGGGIFCNVSNPKITENIISYNTASGSSNGGGGISLNYCDNPIISHNIISNNTSIGQAGGGGGIYCSGSNGVISNNCIINNSSLGRTYGGGGIYCLNTSSPIISSNTISNNNAVNGGALFCIANSDPTLNNTILYGNTASTSGEQVFLADEQSDPNFFYCNVQGGTTAFDLNFNLYTGIYQNNINSNPLFVSPTISSGTGFNGTNADWSLLSFSPCIDSGNPGGPYPATDLAGNPRINDDSIDIGAYEFQVPLSIYSFNISDVMLIYPNPANTYINIVYNNLNAMNGYMLKIVNAIGQTVFTTQINQQTSYIDLSTWTGNGIYFVQLIDPQNNTIENRKIVIK